MTHSQDIIYVYIHQEQQRTEDMYSGMRHLIDKRLRAVTDNILCATTQEG